MDYRDASSITLNGRFYNQDTLLDFACGEMDHPNSETWQRNIYRFLIDWLGEKDHVTVKTSGSTGAPKEIPVKKKYMVNSALKTGSFLGLKRDDRALLCLPAEYIAGKMMLVRAMVLGLDLTSKAPSSNPLADMDASFAFCAMVPMQVHETLKNGTGMKKLNKIRNLIVGGGPVNQELRSKIRQLTNRSYSTYGMTETITHIAMEPLNGPKANGWLKTLPDVNISTDRESRLIIDAPEIAQEQIYTNDLAEIKDEKRFRIIGRYDNIIISGGIKLIPEAIEKKISRLISDRFIISTLPDERLGEMPVLVLEGKAPKDFSENELLKKIAGQVDKYQKPKKIIWLETFPDAGNRKINRRKIKEIIARNS